MQVDSVTLGIAVSLFLGGLGIPVPENPVLLAGGYAIYRQIGDPLLSICIWFFAILCGDLLLFSMTYGLFTHPAISNLVTRYVGQQRLNRYQRALACRGGRVLFLARFTFGLRAIAYIVAGAARFPRLRFVIVDGLGVAIQVLLFVGIGCFAGDRIKWAKATGQRIAVLLALFALVTAVISWLFSKGMKKLSRQVAPDEKGAC